MSWIDEALIVKKTTLGYKEVRPNEEPTHVILDYQSFNKAVNECKSQKEKIIAFQSELKNAISNCSYEKKRAENREIELSRLKKNLDDCNEKLAELTKKNEKLTSICSSFIRQSKDRANQEKNQYPKREHTGYSLVYSNPKDYQYIKHGDRKKVVLYETIFQTPYSIDYSYSDAYELVDNELVFGEDDTYELLDYMGAEEFSYLNHYEDLSNEFKNEEIKESNIFFNLGLRMNGRAGYWEMIINHTKPLASPPKTMRFVTKKAKESK